jgi:hypothetical protein
VDSNNPYSVYHFVHWAPTEQRPTRMRAEQLLKDLSSLMTSRVI